MSTLQRLQQDFQHYIYVRDEVMQPQVIGSERASANERLAVYADAYRLRLIEVLGEDYPALKSLLGEAEFERIARACIEANPSTHRNMRWYSAVMATWLRTQDFSPPWLAELAAFEAAMNDAFDAPDEPLFGLDDMRNIPPAAWPGMVIVPQPSLRCLPLHWDVAAVRKAVDNAQAPAAPEALGSIQHWLIWRKQLTVYHRRLGTAEAWALQALLDGDDFAAICTGLTRWHSPDNAAPAAAGLLQSWLGEELITRIEHSTAT